jgi:hypothetical protein
VRDPGDPEDRRGRLERVGDHRLRGLAANGDLLCVTHWKSDARDLVGSVRLLGQVPPPNVSDARISPDGRLLAYQIDNVGQADIFLTRYPSGEGQCQLGVDGSAQHLVLVQNWEREIEQKGGCEDAER